jgi:alcohol dehydrogenase class IV
LAKRRFIVNAVSHATEATWAAPVAIRIGERPPEFIHSPTEAIGYLEHRWPVNDGIHFEAARRRCVEAMNHLGHIEAAREAFIAAAAEAGILL